jgi:DNA-binding NtrC family response regulator
MPDPEPDPLAPRARILVVDDEPQVRSSLVRVLRYAGIPATFDEASSAEEAIEMVLRSPYDLVISDQRMPGKGGVHLLSWLRTAQPHTSRVLMTAFHDVGVAVDAANKGRVHHYIQKPWDNDQVAALIRGILAEQRSDALRSKAFDNALALFRRSGRPPDGR